MNTSPASFMVAALLLLVGFSVRAQYKAPSQYFPKSRPIPGAPNGRPSAPSQPPAAPQQARFKDVTVNSQFYFKTDTNRVYSWTKISTTTAKNNKSGITQVINGEIPVQK